MAKPRVPVEVSEAALSVALRDVEGGARLVVSVKPKAKQEGLEVGPDGGVLVRVAAPPVDGKANARLVEVLAAALGLPRSGVRLVRGETARHKELELDLAAADARERLLGNG